MAAEKRSKRSTWKAPSACGRMGGPPGRPRLRQAKSSLETEAASGRRQNDGNEAMWDKIVGVPWRKKSEDDAKMD